MQNEMYRYHDILHLAHPVSARHRPMSRPDRASQFSPFAALVGLDTAISQTARSNADEIEYGQYTDELLEWNLQILQMQYAEEEPSF